MVRSATADAHQRSERRLLAGDPLATVQGYRALLEVLGGWELSVRRGLVGPGGRHPAERERLRRRSELLDRDLDQLPPAAGAGAGAGRPALLPFRPDDGAVGALGARYVVEGSRAGGKMLAAAAVRRLGADTPTAFLTDDDRTGWAEVTASLLALPAAGAGPAVATARRAFALVESYLES